MVISICFQRKTCEASLPSSSISLPRMDSLPDAVVKYILSSLSNAQDVASCNCVSKKWNHLMSYHKSLCFPLDIFDNLTAPQTPDSIVMQMVSSVEKLEELVVSCPFTSAGLASWLLGVGSSLKKLELRMANADECLAKLDCIGVARNLRSLGLWRVVMTRTPKWDVFQKLLELEIRGATLEDSVLKEALCATPNLTRFVLGDCKGLSTVCIKLLELRHCQIYVYPFDTCSLELRAPKIEYLKVVGCNRVKVHYSSCLKTLTMVSRVHDVTMVELGDNLMAIESLCVKGNRWRWEVITKLLQLATQVKHLRAEIIFTQDVKESIPSQEIDFVDFFKTHPKLKSLHILGGMIDALCNNHMTTLNNVDFKFVIPCLEEVIITLKSPLPPLLRAKRMIESLLKYGNKLKKININVESHEMHDTADEFSEEIRRTFRDSTTECHVIRKGL